ncbi:MAG: hypothetical protein EU539_09815 [Promethearchaeota archaeon]|nr:MAG: hypothetical protein EU539_09815 [Candidatus Lokiarchaeota archaeon]
MIETSLKKSLLIKDEDNNLNLSDRLFKEFKNWQNNKKKQIQKNIAKIKQSAELINKIETDESDNFNVLLKAFLDKGTINRAVTVSDSDINIIQLNFEQGIIKSEIIGSKKDPYIIEINLKNKILTHNCHDYQSRRAENKKFCKHLAKLFLFLKEKNGSATLKILRKMAEKINEWDFKTLN